MLYGALEAETCGTTYEVNMGGKTLSNITGCDAEAVKAVSDGALALAGSGEEVPVGTSTATKVMNTAAVGKAVHSDLSFVTEEECLVACSEYITGCTHVTAGAEPTSLAQVIWQLLVYGTKALTKALNPCTTVYYVFSRWFCMQLWSRGKWPSARSMAPLHRECRCRVPTLTMALCLALSWPLVPLELLSEMCVSSSLHALHVFCVHRPTLHIRMRVHRCVRCIAILQAAVNVWHRRRKSQLHLWPVQ